MKENQLRKCYLMKTNRVVYLIPSVIGFFVMVGILFGVEAAFLTMLASLMILLPFGVVYLQKREIEK